MSGLWGWMKEICNCTIRTEVYCQQTYRTFVSCWTWNRAQLNTFTTNLEFIDSKITCLFGPEMMDILCGCISHHRRFPSFLGRFARPLHNTTQHKRNANYKKDRGAQQNRQHFWRSTFQTPIYIYFSLEHIQILRVWGLNVN